MSEAPVHEQLAVEGKLAGELAALYASAFERYGSRALWCLRQLASPTPEEALVVARMLRMEGDLSARQLAEEIERAASAHN